MLFVRFGIVSWGVAIKPFGPARGRFHGPPAAPAAREGPGVRPGEQSGSWGRQEPLEWGGKRTGPAAREDDGAGGVGGGGQAAGGPPTII
jgi:hypothetical protein